VGEVELESKPRLSTSRNEAARRLAATRRKLFLASTASVLAALWTVWTSGFSAASWQFLSQLPIGPSLVLAVYVVLQLGVLALLALPFSWYGGYWLAHRFELSRQSLPAWLVEWLKATLIGLVLGSLAVLTFYGALALAGPGWWGLFGVVASLAMLVLTFVAPYLLVPIFYRMQPLQNKEVAETVRRLSEEAGAEVRDVCTLDFSRKTVEANAAVIGLGRSRRVVLADTLLEQFTLPEVRSVVAHELGHHVHRDVLRLMAIQAAFLWVGLGLAAVIGDPLLAVAGARGGMAEPLNLPLLLLGAELFGLLALPIGNALSRRLEASADFFALELTRDPGSFASAMRKLADQNLVEAQPPRWAEVVLSSHPPIAKRIRMAEAVDHARAA
jgi:STE24 endopeptidase